MKPVGHATLKNGEWKLVLAPHAMVRFKRVFGSVATWAAGAVSLSDTPVNCRELLWFADRFPITFSDRAHLEERADTYDKRQAAIETVLSADYQLPEVDLALPPRDYQRRAAALCAMTGRLLLADDLGLGKTASAITTLVQTRAFPATIVTMAHLTKQWQDEFRKFAPGLTTHVLRTGKGDWDVDLTFKGKRLPDPDVVITNYSKLAGWAPVLRERSVSVVFDEAQELRLTGSNKYQAAVSIAENCAIRMQLTATPVYNYGDEIHSVLSVIAPDTLGTEAEFRREWAPSGKVSDPKALGSYLYSTGLMLRRTRAEVGRELPPVQRITHTIESDPAPINAASNRAAELARIILGNSNVKGEKWRAAEEISYLVRQATGIAKAPYIAAFVRMLVETGEKVVLYAWHRAVYDLLEEALSDLKPAFYTGHESESAKRESKRRFVDGETPILILSLRSGQGLDGLQFVCHTCVFGELDWSPGVMEQCVGRVDRDGQPLPVTAWILVTDSGSDPVISDVLGLKASQSHAIRDPQADIIQQLTVDPEHIKKLAMACLRQHGSA